LKISCLEASTDDYDFTKVRDISSATINTDSIDTNNEQGCTLKSEELFKEMFPN
jgi:hypothetical protein